MRIIIVGAGETGRHLGRTLSKEGHDLYIIDHNRASLVEAEEHFDVITIHGNGSHPEVLEEADITRAEMLLALSDSDETNMITCCHAKAAGVQHCVARISHDGHFRRGARISKKDLGIDLIVNPSGTIAHELFNLVVHPGVIELIGFFDNRVQVAGVLVSLDSTIAGLTVSEIAIRFAQWSMLLVGVMRSDKLIVPTGDTSVAIGDRLYFATYTDDLDTILPKLELEEQASNKVVIAGGGECGLALARLLERTTMRVYLLEKDESRALHCSEALKNTRVIMGTALSEVQLKEIDLENAVFIALTGNDERNVMACMQAGSLGASHKYAEISRTEYISTINDHYFLNRAVSAYNAISRDVLRFIRGQNVASTAISQNLPGELIQFALCPGHKWSGNTVQSAGIPEGVIVVAVARGHEVSLATGGTAMEAGDQVTIFTGTASPGVIQKILKT